MRSSVGALLWLLAAANYASAFTSSTSRQQSSASRSTTTTTTALSMVDDHARRRACWTTVTAAAALWLLPTTAHAGLLEEFGTDPKNINAIPKATTPPPVSAANNVQIDPSLKGCKSGFLAGWLAGLLAYFLRGLIALFRFWMDGSLPVPLSSHTLSLSVLRLTVRF